MNANLRLIARGGYFKRVSTRADDDDHYEDYSGGLRGIWDIEGSRNLELSYSYDQYDKSRYEGGKRTNDHDYTNCQHIVHGLYTQFWGKNVLTSGADYMHDYLCTYQFTDNKSHSQTSVDAFVQFDYNPLPWLNVIASVRDDYFSESNKNALTTRLATMFKLSPFTIRASYSGGFRAPTLKEMHMYFDMAGIQMIYGNLDLKPERSHNFNIALERNGQIRNSCLSGSYSATVSGYYNYSYNERDSPALFGIRHGRGRTGDGYNRCFRQGRYPSDSLGAIRRDAVLDRMGGVPVHVLRQSFRDAAIARPLDGRGRHPSGISHHAGLLRLLDDDNGDVYLQHAQRQQLHQLVAAAAVRTEKDGDCRTADDASHIHSHVHGADDDPVGQLPAADVLL